MKRFLFPFGFWGNAVLLGMLFAEPVLGADLELFQNYFGTLDYSVTGTGGIRGTGKLDPITKEYLAEKTIKVNVPGSADIVAAFLYWQTVEKTNLPSSARAWLSYPNTSAANARVKILGKPLGNDHAAPCWSNGGSTGSSNGAPTLRVYRVDVMRYLKAPGSSTIATDITVRVRDSGSNGSSVPLTEGASLVLVYRHPSLKFKSIVLFDGAETMDNKNDSMELAINGFYQAKSGVLGDAKFTPIVGNGQTSFSERLFFNNSLLATNPFQNGWDDKTYNLLFPGNLPPGQIVSTVSTRIDHLGTPFDCLSWAAAVFSTTVEDSDEDGLLDVWETDGYKDLSGNMLVDLRGIANPLKKDLFVEIDYMAEEVGTKHSHLPKLEALQMVGEAFAKAPVSNPNGSVGINVFFDVGNNYQSSPYILRNGALKGGDKLNERWPATFCTTPASGPVPGKCVFPNQPGLISWKKGFQHVKNNYFSEERNSIFHYVLFGHGLAVKGLPGTAPGTYEARSVSGRADLPGNGVAITVGRWRSSGADALVGSANLQASTLLHELAHNLWGFHGGITQETAFTDISQPIVSRPNCNPNKQSSLNYLYQSAGLLDAQGVFRVNLSGQVLTADTLAQAQHESGLKENLGLGAGNTAYRLRWYAPLSNVQANFKTASGSPIALSAARAHCDGLTPIAASEVQVVRVDGSGAAGNPLARMPVDWDSDRTIEFLNSSLDINFNGKQDLTEDFRGFNDWQSIVNLHGLQQVGTGRNLFALSLGVVASDLLQAGEDDLGEDDLGEDDLGEDDLGEDDLGEDDLGEDDLGEDDLGEDDLGEDDLGEVSEIDEAMAIAIGGNGPTALVATIPNGNPRILLSWSSPAFGGAVVNYLIYRSSNNGPLTEIGQSITTTFTDTSTRNGTTYVYTVIAVFQGNPNTLSSPSPTVTVTQ